MFLRHPTPSPSRRVHQPRIGWMGDVFSCTVVSTITRVKSEGRTTPSRTGRGGLPPTILVDGTNRPGQLVPIDGLRLYNLGMFCVDDLIQPGTKQILLAVIHRLSRLHDAFLESMASQKVRLPQSISKETAKTSTFRPYPFL